MGLSLTFTLTFMRRFLEEFSKEIEKLKGKAKASVSWARLIHKIFDVDPLLCPHCGKEMKIIAFITSPQEIKKILKHIGEEIKRAPPSPLYHELCAGGLL